MEPHYNPFNVATILTDATQRVLKISDDNLTPHAEVATAELLLVVTQQLAAITEQLSVLIRQTKESKSVSDHK